LIHMVEPNVTDRERYSVAFNMNTDRLTGAPGNMDYETWIPIDEDWNKFEIENNEVKK